MGFSLGSLGSLAGMVLGGVVGSLLYPGAGTWLGIALGGALGGIAGMALFPEQQRSNRIPPPQPRENRQQISTYGAAVPIVYGAARLAGNIIYMSEVRETLSVYKYRVNGQRVRDYTRLYTATFAVAFCEGEIPGIARIWINGKVFADYRTPNSPQYPVGDWSLAYVNWQTSLARSQVYFSVHFGSRLQGPDASIAAILGAGETPAYRGVCYIVFRDFPVGEFGGVPQVEIEIDDIPYGNLLCHRYTDLKLYRFRGLSGTAVQTIQFSHPFDGSWTLQNNVATTPTGDLLRLATRTSSGTTYARAYVFDGLSATVKGYIDFPADPQGCGHYSICCHTKSGDIIFSRRESYDGGTCNRPVFYVYSADGTLKGSWGDQYEPGLGYPQAYPYGAGGRIMQILDDDSVLVLYRNSYLLYYQTYDYVFLYRSYLTGGRVWPIGDCYMIGPVSHDTAVSSPYPTSCNLYVIGTHIQGNCIWAMHPSGAGHYKFTLSDLLEHDAGGIAGTSWKRKILQVPQRCYREVSPAHSFTLNDGLWMTTGFEG